MNPQKLKGADIATVRVTLDASKSHSPSEASLLGSATRASLACAVLTMGTVTQVVDATTIPAGSIRMYGLKSASRGIVMTKNNDPEKITPEDIGWTPEQAQGVRTMFDGLGWSEDWDDEALDAYNAL